MQQAGEISRMNYALTKHHCQNLRDQIDPKLIEQIEVSENPSLNYRNAFKTVYHDELQKTIQIQEKKKQQEKYNQLLLQNCKNRQNWQTNDAFATLDASRQSPLSNSILVNSALSQTKSTPIKLFPDFEQERRKKFDIFIEKGYDGGQSFFRAQDEYQKRKQQQNYYTKSALQQQMRAKEMKKMRTEQQHYNQIEEVKQNRLRQIQLQKYRLQQQKMQKIVFGEQVKHQVENDKQRKGRKSYFQYNQVGRHNPITNPIEYHIDNPYILQKYQQKYRN